jgi:AcrR family transcriptional regulator
MSDDRRMATAPPERPRGRPRRAATGAAIVEAALAVLAERGFQAATMDAIAARAGVGKNTIYRRWRSKEELIADALRELTAELEPKADGDLRALLLEHLLDLERVFGDPLLGRLLPGLLGELQSNPEFAAAWADRVVRPRRQEIVELLARALERGELREGTDPEAIADLLVGPTFLRHVFPFGLPDVPPRYVAGLLDAIWHGIAPANRYAR